MRFQLFCTILYLFYFSCTSSNPQNLQNSRNLPPPAKPANNSTTASNRASRYRVELPKAEDFYAIFQQHKRKHSVSPSPTPNGGNSTASSSPAASNSAPPSPEAFLRGNSTLSRRSSCRAAYYGDRNNSTAAAAAKRASESGGKGGVRQRSASPKCRSKVDFWEERTEGEKRREENMSAKAEIQIKGGGIMER